MTQQQILLWVRAEADEQGVNEDLAVAICLKESGALWPARSTRFEPGWETFLKPADFAGLNGISVMTEKREQATSWGPMHVMGTVARELGFRGPLPMLFQPDQGIKYGVAKLKALAGRYEDEMAVIASYNGGSPQRVSPGGAYRNQGYVDEVVQTLKRLRLQEET